MKKNIDSIINETSNRYALVNAVARKAREISLDAQEKNEVITEKPVNIVIDMLLSGMSEVRKTENSDIDEFGGFPDVESSDEAAGGKFEDVFEIKGEDE